jgi:hypothetical protein
MAKQVMVSSKVRKYMTLGDLEKEEKGPVFVQNVSTGDEAGQVLITVPKKNGNGSDLVKVPKTFIPMDLTSQVPRSQLIEAAEFRKTITGGLLKLCTPEYAEMLLNSEDGKDEARRIANDLLKTKTLINNAGVRGDENDEEEYADREDAAKEARKGKDSKRGNSSVSVKLQNLVASADEDDLSERDILSKIRNYNNGDLERAELDFLGKKYKNKPRIFKYLQGVHAEMKKAKASSS